MYKKFLCILLVSASVVFGGCQKQSVTVPVVTSTPAPILEFSFTATESGKTALEVTRQHVTVTSKQYDFGVMVQGINGQTPDSTHFWGLYVNNQLAQTGADKLVVYKNDIVGWKYETIK